MAQSSCSMNMLKRNQPRTIKIYEVNKIHKPREKLVYVPVLQDDGRLVKKLTKLQLNYRSTVSYISFYWGRVAKMKVNLYILLCVGYQRKSFRLIGMKLNFVELNYNFNAIFICMNIDSFIVDLSLCYKSIDWCKINSFQMDQGQTIYWELQFGRKYEWKDDHRIKPNLRWKWIFEELISQ